MKEKTSGPKGRLLKSTKISKSKEPQLGEGWPGYLSRLWLALCLLEIAIFEGEAEMNNTAIKT